MVYHVVMWKLKENVDKAQASAAMKAQLEALVGKVPGLLQASVGVGFSGYDVCLYSVLEDRQALEAYQDHPEHVKVKEYIGTVAGGRAACDWEA